MSITALIDSLLLQEGISATNYLTIEHSLLESLATSSCPVDDAAELFYRLKSYYFRLPISRLRGCVFERLSSEAMVELVQRLKARCSGNRVHFRFLTVIRPFLHADLAVGFFEKFKVVIFEICRLLGIKQHGNFVPLKILDIKTQMSRWGVGSKNVDWASLLSDRSVEEKDEGGNTCINYVLTREQYSVYDIRTFICAFPGTLSVPNDQGTLPMHNIFTGIMLTQPLETFKVMMDTFSGAVLCPSLEYHGKTPFHIIVTDGFLMTRRIIDRAYHSEIEAIELQFTNPVATAIRKHPRVLCLVDDYGFTPLHHLVSTLASRSVPFDLFTSRFVASLATPMAARIASTEGKIPLHTALEALEYPPIWNELPLLLVNKLCAIAPDAMERRHPKNFLYPFQMAASRNLNVDISYTLLRMAPQLIATALTDTSTAHLRTKEHVEAAKLELTAERKFVQYHRLLEEMKATHDAERKELLQQAERLRMSTSKK